MSQLSCAVVVISHGYGRYLAEAIESVLNQDRPADELVVVLDHPVDESEAVARRYPVRVVRHDGCDIHLSRRLGARAVMTETLLFLDGDDRLPPDYLEEGLLVFESADADVGIVTGDVQHFGAQDGLWEVQVDEDRIEQANCVATASLLRRHMLDETGVLEDLTHVNQSCEDWECWKQCVAAGWRIEKAPIAIGHRRHEDNETLTNQYANTPMGRNYRRTIGYRDRRIKILTFGEGLGPGGVAEITANLHAHSRKLNGIGLWMPCEAGMTAELRQRLPEVATTQRDLHRLGQRAEVLSTYGASRELVERVRVAAPNRPLICGVHEEGPWRRAKLAQIADLVDAFWCVSPAAVGSVPRADRPRTWVIPGGIDLARFVPTRSREQVRTEWGLVPDQIAVGYVGRSSGEKRPDPISEAIAALPEARLICCSPEANRPANPFRRRIAQRLGERVVWTSSDRQPLGDVYRSLDCLIVASPHEGIPLVTLEAWLAGVPVVSTPCGILPALERRHGKLAEPIAVEDQPERLAQAIRRAAIANSELRAKCRELVIDRFTAGRMTNDFERMVEAVARGGWGKRSPYSLSLSSPSPAPRPFLIRSFPRSGTHMLQTALNSHPELVCEGEVFNRSRPRTCDLTAEELLDRLLVPGGGFAFQGQTRPCEWQSDETLRLPRLIAAREPPPLVLVLNRRDLVRRSASKWIAWRDKRWFYFQRPERRPEPIVIAPETIATDIDEALVSREAAYRQYPDALWIWYEDLLADWEGQLERVQRAIGVRTVRPLAPRTKRIGGRPIRQTIANFDELRERFAGTEYER